MIFHPLQALARRFHLGEIVVAVRLYAHNRCHGPSDIDNLLPGNRGDPARGSKVKVGVPRLHCAYPHTNEFGVTPAAVYFRSREQAQRIDDAGR